MDDAIKAPRPSEKRKCFEDLGELEVLPKASTRKGRSALVRHHTLSAMRKTHSPAHRSAEQSVASRKGSENISDNFNDELSIHFAGTHQVCCFVFLAEIVKESGGHIRMGLALYERAHVACQIAWSVSLGSGQKRECRPIPTPQRTFFSLELDDGHVLLTLFLDGEDLEEELVTCCPCAADVKVLRAAFASYARTRTGGVADGTGLGELRKLDRGQTFDNVELSRVLEGQIGMPDCTDEMKISENIFRQLKQP